METMDVASSSSAVIDPIRPIQPPQRRVLPSRSRRAGPGAGVGNCDADQMILDAHKRKLEDVPLIPENTRFFLTTSDTLAPPEASSSRIAINPRSDDRYFDRPEVIKAFREQTNIETPEFSELKDTPEAEGLSRFRARDTDESSMDTSDAAYERRHRKYEAMEKRQRLRELEKLKHEQYKLKERIEQLRSMDPSAFLALPASSFTPAPGHVPVAEDNLNASIPGGHANGSAAIHEGERRRKEMLEVATTLESRYRILLPPERHTRKVVPGGSNPVQPTTQLLAPTEFEVSSSKAKRPNVDEPESEVGGEDGANAPVPAADGPLKLKIKLNPKKPKKLPTEEHPPFAAPDRAESYLDTPLTDSAMSSPAIAVLEDGHDAESSRGFAKGRGRGRPRLDGQPPRKRVKVVAQDDHPDAPVDTASAASVPPREQSIPPIETIGESLSAPAPRRPPKSTQPRNPPKKPQTCMLVIVAKRGASANPRGGIRHNTAFGFKVPPELDMELTYELPLWLLMDDEFQKRAAKYHPNTGVLDPDFHLDPQFIEDVRRASTEPAVEMTNDQDAEEDPPVTQDALPEKKDNSPNFQGVPPPNTEDALTGSIDVSSNKGGVSPKALAKDIASEPSGDHPMDYWDSLTPPDAEDDEAKMRDEDIESEDEFVRSKDSR